MLGKKKVRNESLSQIFLQPKTPAPQPVPRSAAQTRMSKLFLAFLAIICTTTVTAFFIVSAKQEGSAPVSTAAKNEYSSAKKETKPLVKAQKSGSGQPAVADNSSGQTPKTQQTDATSDTPFLPNDAVTNGSPVISDPVYTPISRKLQDEAIIEVKYRIRSSAPVYKRPDAGKEKIASVKWQKSFYPFNALAEENGFVYAILANNKGYEVEGWLRKKDLVAINTVYHASDLK